MNPLWEYTPFLAWAKLRQRDRVLHQEHDQQTVSAGQQTVSAGQQTVSTGQQTVSTGQQTVSV
jgi:hypothetical protein